MLLIFVGLIAFASAELIVQTTRGNTTVVEGIQLKLECQFDFDWDLPVIWKKNEEEFIAADDDIMFSDPSQYQAQIDTKKNIAVLTIVKVEPHNSDYYVCSPSDLSVRKVFSIMVQVKPTVNISPDSGFYHARVGEQNLVLKCNVNQAYPKPSITWSKQGKEIPHDFIVDQEGRRITIANVTKEHAGTYTCSAENKIGSSSAKIAIHVSDPLNGEGEEKPWVRNEDSFIPVKKNQKVSIWCTYDGTPAPQVEWLFNGYKINMNEEKFSNISETAQRLNGYTKAMLTIPEISEEAFGDYACRVSNNLGSVTTVVHVSGRPGPPEMTLDDSELTWTVRAYDKVLEYQLCHRFENQDHFLPEDCDSIRVKKNDNNGDDKWTHTVDLLSYLEKGARYHVQLKARNALGWGSMAKEALLVELKSSEQAKMGSVSSTGAIATFVSLAIIGVFNL